MMDNTCQINKPIHLLVLHSSRQKILLFTKKIQMLNKLRAEPEPQWRDIRCMMTKADTCEYFAAARIILRDVYGVGINYFYDDLTFESQLFIEVLGILNEQTVEFVNNSNEMVFIIEWSDVLEINNDIIDTRNGLKWFDISDIAKDSSISNLTVSLVSRYQQRFNLQKQQLNQYFIFDVEPEVLFQNFYGSLYQSKYRKENENWKVYKIFENQLPSIKDLEKCKAIVISGSRRDVDGDEDYLKRLCEFIRMVFELASMPKIVGICFGHQIIAHALGGNVGPVDDLQNKAKYFQFFDVKNLRLNYSFLQCEFVNKLSKEIDFQKGLNISKAHGYEVKQIPFFMTSYGDSVTTKHEIIGIPDRMLSFQGHPEFNVSFMECKLMPEKVALKNAPQQRTNQIIDNYIQLGLDNNKINMIIRNFMDS